MGLLYAIFSIFITLFFPKQITDVICYGRHRDRENIKSKKIYCLIYVFWTFFFGLFCLMMGSASGVNNTFDRVLDYYGLNFVLIFLYSINNLFFLTIHRFLLLPLQSPPLFTYVINTVRFIYHVNFIELISFVYRIIFLNNLFN